MNKKGKHLLQSIQIPPIQMQEQERYLPTAFDDSLSILEKINKVIQHLYEYSHITEEMLGKWNEVYGWVLGEGLDEAVGGRLNEWLNDGTLHSIINNELFKELNTKIDNLENKIDKVVDNVNEILEDEILEINNLINSLLGEIENTINEFKIDVTKNISEKIDVMGFYHELGVSTYRDSPSQTTYYLIKIPKRDSNGDRIVLKHGIANDSYAGESRETVREFSKRKGATFVTNVSPSLSFGRLIQDGNIIQDTQAVDPYRQTLAFDEQMNMRYYPYNISAQTIINDGYTNAMTVFFNLLENGNINTVSINGASDYLKEVHPRTAIAQNINGDTYIFLCDGRRVNEYGMTPTDTARVLKSHGFWFAQMFDGGGSTQATLYHTNINKLSDRVGSRADGYVRGTVERLRQNFIYVGKDSANDPLNTLLGHLGDLNKNQDDHLSGYENLRYSSINWVEMEQYLVNGWKNFGTSGASKVRAWNTPNNSLYLVGTITDGDPNKPFMVLPPNMRPNFTFHFLVPGNVREKIYKVVVNANGNCQMYYWTDKSATMDTNYIKLDGIFFPTNPVNSGE